MGVVYRACGAGLHGASYFLFSVSAAGDVIDVLNAVTLLPSGAATASGQTLSLANATITVNPGAYTGRYFVSSQWPQPSTGIAAVVLVPELVYYIDNGSAVASATDASYFYFGVDAGGQITPMIDPFTQGPSGAATASGATLTLMTTLLSVDPGTYFGMYRVGGSGFLAGPSTLSVISTLLTVVVAGDQAGYIVPTATAVVPSILDFVVGGQPYPFTFDIGVAGQIGMLNKLVRSLPLNPGIASSLIVKIGAMLAAVQSGTASGCSSTVAFIHEVSAQSGKQIPAASAALLIDFATQVRAALQCP